MLGEKSYIKRCKSFDIDIVVDSGGFKTVYYVYSKYNEEGERFENFKELKEYCDKLIQISV